MSKKQYLSRIGLVFLTGIFWICDAPTISEVDPIPQINNVIFEYHQDNSQIWVQVEVSDPQGIENIDSVWVELESLSTSEVLYHFLLEDGGLNGDILSGNGVYTVQTTIPEGIPFAVYRIKTYARDMEDNLGLQPGVISIEEEFPPQIELVDMPSLFHLDPTEWGTLTIQLKINDPNGADDISYVRYAINTDFLTIDCDGNPNPDPDPDHYQWDPSWEMTYLTTDVDGFLIYQTDIPMRPADDGSGICGKTGLVLFQFTVRDKSNQIAIKPEIPLEQEIVLEITKCGDGNCLAEFEDATTCPEDCQ